MIDIFISYKDAKLYAIKSKDKCGRGKNVDRVLGCIATLTKFNVTKVNAFNCNLHITQS